MGLIQSIKSFWHILRQIDKIPFYEQNLELRKNLDSIVGENQHLKAEVANLREKLELKESLTFLGNYYICTKDGSFCCSACWDNAGKLVRLHRTGRDSHYYGCPVCGQVINFQDSDPPPQGLVNEFRQGIGNHTRKP